MKSFVIVMLLTLSLRGAGAQMMCLYETGETNRQIILTGVADEGETSVSQVIICDSIHVRTNGEAFDVVMKNVGMYTTKLPRSPSSKLSHLAAQERQSADEMTMHFDRRDKVVFRSKVCSWGELNITVKTSSGTPLIFEGDELKRELKRRGLELPPEADVK